MKRLNKNDNDINFNNTDLANMFSVYDNDNVATLNLCQTVQFDGVDNVNTQYYSDIHEVTGNETWTFISWKYYNTINLWWIICKFNGVNNPTVLPTVGTKLYIPHRDIVDSVLNAFNQVD